MAKIMIKNHKLGPVVWLNVRGFPSMLKVLGLTFSTRGRGRRKKNHELRSIINSILETITKYVVSKY